jgi:glycosyltransferase involved in cell wall biosynthesis
MPRRLVIVCNALDDETRTERGINTDSPAASRKVFMMAMAVRRAGARVHVVSFARGRQDGSGRLYRLTTGRRRGVSVVYLPFWNLPVLSELLSLLAPIPVLCRLRRFQGETTVVFYNSMALHVAALLSSAILGLRTVLDLEDGEPQRSSLSAGGVARRVVKLLFEALCSGGAMLANTALAHQTRLRPNLCYYGTVQPVRRRADWREPRLRVLLGGTVSRDTGAMQLIEAVRLMREDKSGWCAQLQFEITGNGDCVPAFLALASDSQIPAVAVHGRLTDVEYDDLVGRSHVGLALKPCLGKLADTTFPSKVIELANAGLIIVTTDISDVRKILGVNALYLKSASPLELIERLQWIANNTLSAQAISQAGASAVRAVCAPEFAGRELSSFLFDAANDPTS